MILYPLLYAFSSISLAMLAKKGLAIFSIISAMVWVFPVRKLRASELGLYPVRAMYFSTFFTTSSLILFSRAFPFKIKDTAVAETFNSRAISFIDNFFCNYFFVTSFLSVDKE